MNGHCETHTIGSGPSYHRRWRKSDWQRSCLWSSEMKCNSKNIVTYSLADCHHNKNISSFEEPLGVLGRLPSGNAVLTSLSQSRGDCWDIRRSARMLISSTPIWYVLLSLAITPLPWDTSGVWPSSIEYWCRRRREDAKGWYITWVHCWKMKLRHSGWKTYLVETISIKNNVWLAKRNRTICLYCAVI